ncbi:MAG: hypothetical protein JKP95_03655 [Oceanicaulis sp.]|nr:hypothetical protein [Oceanicaulis sp.]
MAWGWDYFYLSDRSHYRVSRFTNIQSPAGDLDVYVETTRWFGLTTRLGRTSFSTPPTSKIASCMTARAQTASRASTSSAISKTARRFSSACGGLSDASDL